MDLHFEGVLCLYEIKILKEPITLYNFSSNQQ